MERFDTQYYSISNVTLTPYTVIWYLSHSNLDHILWKKTQHTKKSRKISRTESLPLIFSTFYTYLTLISQILFKYSSLFFHNGIAIIIYAPKYKRAGSINLIDFSIFSTCHFHCYLHLIQYLTFSYTFTLQYIIRH